MEKWRKSSGIKREGGGSTRIGEKDDNGGNLKKKIKEKKRMRILGTGKNWVREKKNKMGGGWLSASRVLLFGKIIRRSVEDVAGLPLNAVR